MPVGVLKRYKPRFGLRNALVAMAVVAALLVLVRNYLPIAATDMHVCSKCGMELKTTSYRFPFTYKEAYSRSDELSTPISSVLADHDLIEEHEHQWQFAHGSGMDNDEEFFEACGATEYGRFLDDDYARDVSTLLSQLKPNQRKVVARCILSPETTEITNSLFYGWPEMIQSNEFSASELADLSDVEKWIDQNRHRLSMSQEPAESVAAP